MRSMCAGLFVAVVNVVAQPAATGTRQSATSMPPTSPAAHSEPSPQPPPSLGGKAYRQLFDVPDLPTPSVSPSAQAEAPGKPRVVCGMTIIPVDPHVDPHIRVGPSSPDTRHTLRIIPPPVCR